MHVWLRLVAAHPGVPAIEQRSAQLLAAVLFVLIVVGSGSGIIQLVAVPNFWPTFVTMMFALGALAVAYGISRTRRWRIAAVIASVIPIGATAWISASNPHDRVWYAFMMIGVLVATTFLPVGAAAGIGLLALSSIAIVVAAVPELQDPTLFLPPLAFHAVFTPMLLFAAAHRNRVFREREELVRKLEQARRLETIGRLAGGVAHDFNNLLTVILANTDLLRRRHPRDPELSGIADASERAAALTSQLLTFARRKPSAAELVDANQVVRGLHDVLGQMVGARVALEVELSDAPALIKADPVQLEQVILNLVTNGRDALADTGGRIKITTARSTREGVPIVEVAVTDDGPGMDRDTIEHMFEPFFTTKPSGTGLGLAIVYGIVQQSSGHIDVDSTPGAGSTIRVAFPRHGTA
jgi:signal transduction histidine kinase